MSRQELARRWQYCRPSRLYRLSIPFLSYYNKMGSLSKYVDGYDNQFTCWMDDPCAPDQRTNEASVTFKNVVGSSGPCQVEIKYGSMQFDSYLIIITSNTPPDIMAESFGPESALAMKRRFYDPPGQIPVHCRQDAKNLVEKITKVIGAIAKKCFDIHVDVEAVKALIPLVEHVEFDI